MTSYHSHGSRDPPFYHPRTSPGTNRPGWGRDQPPPLSHLPRLLVWRPVQYPARKQQRDLKDRNCIALLGPNRLISENMNLISKMRGCLSFETSTPQSA